MVEPFLQIRQLTKSYGGVHALIHVNIDIAAGEIHALCGENGAGKSTLIKCLTGVVTADDGAVRVNGQSLHFGSVQASEAAGIAVIHQESTAFADLNTIDNVFVGREPRVAFGLLLNHTRMRRETMEALERLGQSFDIDCPVSDLSVAQRQVVAMARALSQQCRLLIMDEPTASLSSRETRVLLDIVRRLRDEGVTILYASHRLEEILEMADRVTVLRDGEHVATCAIADIDRQELIRFMVGREVEELTRRHEHEGNVGDVRLEVRGVTRRSAFEDVNFMLRAGEIVGLSGLVGAGRTEVARAIFGIDCYDSGEVLVGGQSMVKGNVLAAMQRGLALVPEDRQHEGLVLPMSVGANLSLAILKQLTTGGLINQKQERDLVDRLMKDLMVKASSQSIAADTLSGGNQQKLVIGKWLASQPKVLILDEPTRGVDVAAKAQVHRLIRQLAAKGMATLMISSELPEILSICDRVLVMREGRISGELEGRTATQEEILQLALPQETQVVPT